MSMSFSAPVRVCLCGEDLDWLGFRCVAAAVRIYLTVSLASDNAAEFFDPRILDNIWELTAVGFSVAETRPPIKVNYDIPLASGLGSSSAAALATAYLYHDIQWGEDGLAEADRHIHRRSMIVAAYEAERRVTNGGGMDHVAIAEGGVMLLQGTREPTLPSVVARISQPGDLALVVIDSRHAKISGSHLAWVRQRDAEHDADQAEYCQACDALAAEAWSAIVEHNWMRLGAAVNSAHEAMRDLQHMSTPHLEALRDAVLSAGFPGVKVSGSGSGGCLVAVTRRADVDDQVMAFRHAARAFAPPPAAIPIDVQAAAWPP
jgi:mevalonate kinase